MGMYNNDDLIIGFNILLRSIHKYMFVPGLIEN